MLLNPRGIVSAEMTSVYSGQSCQIGSYSSLVLMEKFTIRSLYKEIEYGGRMDNGDHELVATLSMNTLSIVFKYDDRSNPSPCRQHVDRQACSFNEAEIPD